MLLPNNIYCADCLEILPYLSDSSVDLVITDPPYGMSFRSNYRIVRYAPIANDSNVLWAKDVIEQLYRVMKNNTHLYWFCSYHNVDIFKPAIESKFKVKNIIIWKKNNTGMGDLTGSYAPRYEMIIFAHKGRRLLNGRRDQDIQEFNRTGNLHHPTEKPVDLLEFLIEKSSDEGDLVLDPFIGSGSTALACINKNRRYLGMEIDPEIYRIAEERIKNV